MDPHAPKGLHESNRGKHLRTRARRLGWNASLARGTVLLSLFRVSVSRTWTPCDWEDPESEKEKTRPYASDVAYAREESWHILHHHLYSLPRFALFFFSLQYVRYMTCRRHDRYSTVRDRRQYACVGPMATLFNLAGTANPSPRDRRVLPCGLYQTAHEMLWNRES